MYLYTISNQDFSLVIIREAFIYTQMIAFSFRLTQILIRLQCTYCINYIIASDQIQYVQIDIARKAKVVLYMYVHLET